MFDLPSFGFYDNLISALSLLIIKADNEIKGKSNILFFANLSLIVLYSVVDACWILSYLTIISKESVNQIAISAVPGLISRLLEHAEVLVLFPVLSIITSTVSESSECAHLLIKSNAGPRLIDLLKHSNPHIVEQAVMAMQFFLHYKMLLDDRDVWQLFYALSEFLTQFIDNKITFSTTDCQILGMSFVLV